jgi:hypothetical protein
VEANSAEECSAVAQDLAWDYREDHDGWDPYGWVLDPWEIYGSDSTVIAPGLRAAYAEELILAYEREVGTRSSIELTLVDKKTRDIYDDTCNGNLPTPSADAECEYYVIANVPGLLRDYRGFIISYETRGLSWLTLLTSYTYSSSKGSIEYSQNINTVANHYPWHYENRYGYLSDHRRHRIKLNGYLTLEGDWTIAFDTFWASPFTWQPYENRVVNDEIPYGAHYLEPRGNREANSNYQIDLQVSKGIALNRVRFVLIGSVFNALSSERPTAVCERIYGCGEIDMGNPTNWQVPRRYEVGFRVEF